MKKKISLFALLSLIVISIDWLSKHLIIDQLGLYIIYNPQEPALILLIPLFICCLILIKILPQKVSLLAAALVFGGVAANGIDRALFGPVADFLNKPGSDLYFNLADASIFLGGSCFLLIFIFNVLRVSNI